MGILIIIKQYLNLIIGVAIAGLTFYVASVYYNHKIDKVNNEYTTYRLTTEKNIEAQKVAILSDQNKIKEENIQLIKKLKDIENEKFKLYTSLQRANSTIKSNVASGSTRLYIGANCPTTDNNKSGKTEVTKSTSLDDGKTTRVAIDPRDGKAIIEITEKADNYKNQLSALQDWINNLILENNK